MSTSVPDERCFPGIRRICSLAKGSFSHVYKGTYEKTQNFVAIKSIPRQQLLQGTCRESFETELRILEASDHPFVVTYYNLVETDDAYHFILEYCPGNLCNLLSEDRDLELSRTKKYFTELVSAVYYLHRTLNVVHRDLKLDNLLLDEYDHLKVIDFGLSKAQITGALFSTRCGTLPYLAPEIVSQSIYTEKVDIWSMGVCLYLMAFGKFPFCPDNEAILREEVLTKEPSFPPNIDPNLKDIISQMLQKDPQKRPSIDLLIKHRWLNETQYRWMLQEGITMDPDYTINCELDTEVAEILDEEKMSRAKYNEFGTEDAMMYRILKRGKIKRMVCKDHAGLKEQHSFDLGTIKREKVSLMELPLKSLKDQPSILGIMAMDTQQVLKTERDSQVQGTRSIKFRKRNKFLGRKKTEILYVKK